MRASNTHRRFPMPTLVQPPWTFYIFQKVRDRAGKNLVKLLCILENLENFPASLKILAVFHCAFKKRKRNKSLEKSSISKWKLLEKVPATYEILNKSWILRWKRWLLSEYIITPMKTCKNFMHCEQGHALTTRLRSLTLTSSTEIYSAVAMRATAEKKAGYCNSLGILWTTGSPPYPYEAQAPKNLCREMCNCLQWNVSCSSFIWLLKYSCSRYMSKKGANRVLLGFYGYIPLLLLAALPPLLLAADRLMGQCCFPLWRSFLH